MSKKKKIIEVVEKTPIERRMELYDIVREFIDMPPKGFQSGYLMDLSRPHQRQICLVAMLDNLEEKDQKTLNPLYDPEVDEPRNSVGVVIRKYPSSDVRWPDGLRVTFFDQEETRMLVWEPHKNLNGVMLPTGDVVSRAEDYDRVTDQLEANFKLIVWALQDRTVSIRPLQDIELYLIPNNIAIR